MTSIQQLTLKETVDLRTWLKRCQDAGVPMVPSVVCPYTLPIESILQGTSSDLSAISEWTEEKTREIASKTGKAMWRWSHCAPIEIKAAIANPGLPVRMPWPIDAADDRRLLAILSECHYSGHTDVTTIVRPWVAAAIEADYPVEFRVFVTPDGTSTSSYYTQRALSSKWLPQAEEAAKLALALRPFVPDGVEFAADFLVTYSDEVLFLEGGPSVASGADPCCFPPDHPFGDNQIALQ